MKRHESGAFPGNDGNATGTGSVRADTHVQVGHPLAVDSGSERRRFDGSDSPKTPCGQANLLDRKKTSPIRASHPPSRCGILDSLPPRDTLQAQLMQTHDTPISRRKMLQFAGGEGLADRERPGGERVQDGDRRTDEGRRHALGAGRSRRHEPPPRRVLQRRRPVGGLLVHELRPATRFKDAHPSKLQFPIPSGGHLQTRSDSATIAITRLRPPPHTSSGTGRCRGINRYSRL